MNANAHTELVAFKTGYSKMAPQIASALPPHIPPERFERTAMVAVQQNPDLLKADRRSLFLALQKAANTGLLPDGREGAIVMFSNQAQWMPMVAGLMKLARNSGEIACITAQVAYEGEEYSVVLGDDERIEHKRSMTLVDTGKPIAVYAVATLKSGEKIREVMTTKQVEKVRNVSRAKNGGPWSTWWDEMAKKTAIRRLSKRLPLSTDRDGDERLQRAVEHDDTLIDIPAEQLHDAPPTPKGSKLDALALASEADEDGVISAPADREQADA